MIDDQSKPKPTMQQSLAELETSARSLWVKVSPHLGFIYLTLMLLGITFVVYLVTQTMGSTDIGQGTVTNQKATEYVIPFDKTTIAKVEALSNENSSPTIVLPTGRINPFSESVY